MTKIKSKIIDSFIAFDVETTGFDPVSNKIIEIGAVKVVKGKIKEHFSELINPGIPIPFKITGLTGISSEDVKDKPDIHEVIEKFESFIQDLPLVAHNVEFDKAFINENMLKIKGKKFSNKFYDTLVLSRIIFPFASTHKLADLAVYLKLASSSLHRALNDAQTCAYLWLKLLEEASFFSHEIIRDITEITFNANWIYKQFFLDIDTSIADKKKISEKEINQESRTESHINTSQKIIEEYFNPDGKISKILKNFEYRKQQKIMAEKAMEAFRNKEFLLVESGTGTGKTLAYIIPALFSAIANNTGVIISTNTINLQEQILKNDIPLVSKIVDFDFKTTILKGRKNYICLYKYYNLIKSPEKFLLEEDILDLLTLVRWIYETKTGDISENKGFNLSRHRVLWKSLSCDDDICPGKKCHFYSDCFLFKVRESARESHLVIVNHSLFFIDRGHGGNIIPEFKNYIFDEAHNLEKIACENMGITIGGEDLLGVIGALYGIDKNKKEYGLLASLKFLLLTAHNEDSELPDLLKKILSIKKYIINFWNEIYTLISRGLNDRYQRKGAEISGDSDFQIKIRLKEKRAIEKLINLNFADFSNELDNFSASLLKLINSLMIKFEGEKNIIDIIRSIAAGYNDLQGILDDLDFIFDSSELTNYVYWIETGGYKNKDCYFKSLPLNIADKMNTLVYSNAETIIFSSATLAVGDKFQFFIERMGLDKVEMKENGKVKTVKNLLLNSPFDYHSQSLLLIPEYIPLPSDSDFCNAVSSILIDIALKIKGKHLILFTSYTQLNYVYQKIYNILEEKRILVLGQGVNGNRQVITDRFREHENVLLLGTQSFWEGVDFGGENVKSLIVVKLPFPVPNEPQVEAQVELIEKNGGNSFNEFMIPQAIIKFRQGFGRLIRSHSDLGVVLVLDKRVLTGSYGYKFLESLPVGHYTVSDQNELLDRMCKFLIKRMGNDKFFGN